MKKSFKLLSLLVTVGMLAGCTITVKPEKESQPESTQESTTSQESQGGHSETTSETESQGGQSQESTESHESQGGSSQGGQSESQGGDSQTTESTSEGGQSQESQGGQSEESQGQESQGGESESTTPVKTPHHIVAEYDNEHGKVIVGDTLNVDYLTVDLYYSDNSHDSILDSDDLTFTWNNVEVGPSTPFDAVGDYEIVAHYAPSSLASELTDSFTVNVVKRDVTSVEISAPKTNLETGETIDLTVTIEPNNATIKDVVWTYDNTKLSIADNKLTAGNTPAADLVVYATVDGHKSNELVFQITEPHIAVTSITLNHDILELKHHDEADLSVTSYLPDNASNTEWKFTSDNEAVTVNQTSGHIQVVGYTADTVTITVTNALNEGSAQCLVSVEKLGIESVAIKRADDGVLATEYEVGDADVQLEAVVTPANATDAGADVVWASLDEDVATVENGLLHIVGTGNTTITASVGGKESPDFDITVSYKAVTEISKTATSVELDINDDPLNLVNALTLKVLPEGANPNMTFSIKSGDDVISQADGVVTPIKTGDAVVTVTSVGETSASEHATLDIDVHVTNLYGTETDPISVDKAIEVAEGLETSSSGNEYPTEQIYFVEVVIDEINEDNRSGSYNNITMTAKSSDGTKSLKLFRLKAGTFDDATIEAGQTMVVKGKLEKYGSTLELINGGLEQNIVSIDADTITGLTVAESAKALVAGDEYQIEATKLPEHSANAITYASDNEAAATVSSTGLVQAVAAGTANITVTAGELHETVAITVSKLPELLSINFTETELALKQNEAHQMVLEFVTDDASEASAAQKEVTYSIKEGSAENLITVSPEGVVTASEQETDPTGKTATVVATSNISGSIKAEATISVTNQRMTAQAIDVTYDATEELSNEEIPEPYVSGDMTIDIAKATGSDSPKYYNNGTALRMYKNNTITVSRTAGTVTKVTFGFAPSGDNTGNAITSDVGTFTTDTWTGSANSVIFSFAGARRIQTIRVEGPEKVETIQYVFELTQTLSNATSSNSLLDNINRGDDIDLTFTAESGYSLIPTDVVVYRDDVETSTGVTVTQTSENVIRVVVSDVYEDVEIKVTAQQILSKYAIGTPELTNCTISNITVDGVDQDDVMPTELDANAELAFRITPVSDYEFKNISAATITVGGVAQTPTLNAGGYLEVTLTVTGVVAISATATAKATTTPFDVIYDFNNSTLASSTSALNASSLYNLLKNVSGNSTLITGVSATNNVYPGNSSGGLTQDSKLIKLGSSGTSGSMTLTLGSGYKITSVIIKAESWSETKHAVCTVGGKTFTTTGDADFYTVNFDTAIENELTISAGPATSGDRRTLIFSIEVIGTYTA